MRNIDNPISLFLQQNYVSLSDATGALGRITMTEANKPARRRGTIGGHTPHPGHRSEVQTVVMGPIFDDEGE